MKLFDRSLYFLLNEWKAVEKVGERSKEENQSIKKEKKTLYSFLGRERGGRKEVEQ